MDLITIENIYFVLKILSIPAVLKLYIFATSLKLYGVYNLYKYKKLIYNHRVFNKLDSLYTDQELFNQIPDNARREIFKDIFKIKIHGLNDILISHREKIYFSNNFFKFIFKHKHLDSNTIINLFTRLYNAETDKLEKLIRIKLNRGGLNKEASIFIIQKFYEFNEEFSFMFRKQLLILENRQNLYYLLIDLLDRIEIQIDFEKKFLLKKFMSLNGKLNNVSYKSYESIKEGN